jgi:hypothetical protein
MIQRIVEDDDGSTALEIDLEGIEFLMEGLSQLSESDIGTVLATPALWVDDSGHPEVGEFRLRRVG